jgi:hypothetical protein
MARKPQQPEDSPSSPDLDVAPKALFGKNGSELEIIRWVARNIDCPKPNPKDCPDPFAWTLLRNCRGNMAFQTFFIEKLWSKLLQGKSALEEEDQSIDIDGSKTLDVISAIQELSDKHLSVGDGVESIDSEGGSLVPVASVPHTPYSDFGGLGEVCTSEPIAQGAQVASPSTDDFKEFGGDE